MVLVVLKTTEKWSSGGIVMQNVLEFCCGIFCGGALEHWVPRYSLRPRSCNSCGPGATRVSATHSSSTPSSCSDEYSSLQTTIR